MMTTGTIPFALVVDDDALILMHACDILEGAGFRFQEAASGDEAVRLLETQSEAIILLFTDVEMPGSMNGFELAKLVALRWPDIEIVVASGRVPPRQGDMPDKATFIEKPFTNEMVDNHLRETLPDGKKPRQLQTAV
jgi:CheY-like chemotaxis protein